MDTPNRKENIAKLLGFLKQNGYASKGLSLEGLDTRLQNDSLRRNLYNALSRDKVPDIGSWDEFSSMVKKEKDSTALAQPSTKATSTPLVPNSPLLPSPNKTSKNTLSTDWTKPTPQFSIPTSERNPGVPTLVPSREHPYVGRELAFVSPAEVTNQRTGKKHYDASKTSVIYPNEIGEDNTRKAIDNYTQAKASEANRLDRKIEAQLQDIEKQQKELEARLNKRAKELEAEREGEGWFVNFIRSQPARGMDPMSTINRLTNDGKDQDEEYIGISSALHNLRKQKEKLLATKKSMQEDASFGPFLKNAGRGFVDTVTDTRIWDGGEGDLREAGLAIKAIGKLELQKKFNSGQATKEDAELLRTLYKGQLKLTPAEDALLNSKAGRAYVDAITKEAIGYGYGAGETTANMLPFIRDIALSPANGLGRSVATNVAKSALKSGLSRVATKAISRTARVVSDIALEGAGTALTTGIGGTLKGAADEQIGDIKYDVDGKTGQIVYGGRTNQEENFLKAFGKSLVRQALEYGTEATGGAYIGTLMKPINKYGGKLLTKTLGDKAVSAVEKFFARMEKTSVGKAVNSVGEQVHYDGLPGEYLEEVYNNLLNAVTIGDMKLDTNSNNGVFNPEINKTIIIGLMGAPMATVSLKVGSIVAQDTKTQAMGLRAFGYKQWQEMKTLIGNSDDVSKTISEWAEQNPNATSNQKKAVMRYAVATAMEDAMTVRQALEQKERKKDSATTLTPSQTAEQSGEASAVAPNPPSSSTASESADNTFNPNSDNSKRYEQGNGVILKREDGTSVRAQIVSEENEDGKIEVASSEGAIQGRDRVVYLTREELDQMYQGSFDIDTPDASSNEETQLSDTSIDSTPAPPTPNSDSPIGRPMTEEEAVSFVDKMTAEAEEAPELELTAENWDKEFGDNGVVDTPIGQVHMGEHQFLKMMRQGRNSKLGMIKPTLTNPDIIIEDTSREASSSERSSSYIFAKSFKGTDGERIYYFTSITVSQDGNEVVISNQERRKNRILSLMNSGNILYQKSNSLHPKAQVGESVPLNESLSVTNADNNSDQLGIHSSAEDSESKDSNKVSNIKAEEEADGSVPWMRTDNASETSDVAQGLYSPQGNQLSDPTSEGTVAPQSLPSEDKDTTLSAPQDNTHTQDGTNTTQEAVSDTPHSEESSEEHEWDELSKQVGDESAREIISSDISDLEAERKKLQKEISKPKGQTREEKIQYVIGRRERLQGIDAEIEGLQRVLQVPQMRIAQAEAQEREQNRIKAEEARRQEEHTDKQGNPINENGTLKTEEVQSVDELTDEDFTASSRNVLLPKSPKKESDAIGANEKIKRQANREDGQLLILPSESTEEAGALSSPTTSKPLSERKVSEKTTDLTRSEKEAVIAQSEQELEGLQSKATSLRKEAYQAMRNYYESGAVPDMTEEQFNGEARYMFVGRENRNELALIHAPGLQDILPQLDELANKIRWYNLLIRNSKKDLDTEQNAEGKVESEYSVSTSPAEKGGNFIQNKEGSIDLVQIKQEVFEALGIPAVPFRMTESMAQHVLEQHSQELKITSIEEAVAFVLNVMQNFDHVRKGDLPNTYIFSIENARRKVGKRAVTLVLPSSNGDYLGVSSSGNEDIKGIQKRELLWEEGAKNITPATETASANVPSPSATQGGMTGGSAKSNQSNSLFTDKGSEKTTDLTRSEKEAVIAQAEQELEGLQSEASSLRRKAYQAMRDYYESGAVPDMTEEQFNGEAGYMFIGRQNRNELALIHAPGLQDILPQLDELANKIRWYKLLIRNSKKALNAEQNTEHKGENENTRKSEDNSTEGIRFRRGQEELEEVNDRFNEQLEVLNEKTANSTILSLGSPSNVLLSAGVIDKPMRLYGNKVIKKMKKHGFSLSELRDLPRAVANPIAVFNNYGKDGSRSILTELQTEQGNFLVAIGLGNGTDVEFNIVRSAFGKGKEQVVDWFNSSYATYINKEKALEYLRTPTLIMGAISNQELSDATKVIESFENPNIEEKSSDLTDGIRFRGRKNNEESKTLVGVHNLTEDKLQKALRLGGLANPSIAVIDSSHQQHNGYGEISLVMPSSKINKTTGKNAGTFFGDAYTPRVPIIEKHLTDKGSDLLYQEFRSLPSEFKSKAIESVKNWINEGRLSSGLYQAYLHSTGQGIALVYYQNSEYTKELADKALEIGNGATRYESLSTDQQYAISSLLLGQEGYPKSIEEYTQDYVESRKARLNELEEKIARGEKVLPRGKMILQRGLDYVNEVGYPDTFLDLGRGLYDSSILEGKLSVDQSNAEAKRIADEQADAFNKWLAGLAEHYQAEELLFDGLRSDGSKKYLPATLENISKAMKKQGLQGTEGDFGFHSFAASLINKAGTLNAIRKGKGQLANEEARKAFDEKWSKVFDKFVLKLKPQWASIGGDYVLNTALNVEPKAYAQKEYGIKLTDEDVTELKAMVDAIRNEMPVPYFETKFERPVGFNEFSSAIIPSNLSEELKHSLKAQGLSIHEYEQGNEEDRQRAFNEAIQPETIRFRRGQELQEVNERFNEQLQAQIDGTLPKGHVYSLGMPSDILQSAGIPNLPIELSAERLEKKASVAYSSLHPFNLPDITDLPQSLANPIAVFNSRTKQGAKVILTELKDKRGNNFVVALQVRKSEHSRKMDVEVNDVRSLYPKDRVGGIIGWINQGLLTWVDKKKATEFLSTQEPNYLGGGNQFNSLSDATKVIKEFENPNIEENAFDDDILFRGRYVEFQSGYTERADGTPISNNAKYAEEAGKFPASLFKKKYGISPADFKMLNDLGLIEISEWHHTGATFRETDYYSWVDNATFDDGYNSRQGYDINGEYEYNEQGEATYVGEDENPSMPLSEWYKQNKKAIKPIADAYKAGEWTWEREDPSVGFHRIKNREDAERRMIETYFRKEERQYRNIHWGEYPQSLKNLFSTMLKWDENAHYEDIEAKAERLANEFYDAHIEETLEADRKNIEEGEAQNRAIREKNLSSASKETALMALAKLYGMDEQEAYSKISSSSWDNRNSIRRRSTSSDEASERNQLLAEMEREATRLAHSMGEEVVVVHNEEELVDILGEDGARQARGAKGFYLPKSGNVVIILSNNTDVADVLETIFHEFVGHKGLQEYVGKEEFTAFIDRVHKGLPSKALSEVHREARTIYNERKGTSRAVSYQEAVQEATEEYIARLSERGFSDREGRSTWQKIVDAFRDMISRAKLTLGWNIQDRDIRYILWKSFQMKQKQVAILAEAGDIAMRHRLGLPQKVKVTEGVRERRGATSNDAEMRSIKAQAKKDGTFMKAPNGKPTKLTEKQWLQVRTQAFKNWFGDWMNAPEDASKVLDENGEPMIVYHGSKNKFYSFDMGLQKTAWMGKGFYFTPNKEFARSFGRSVVSSFLNLRNPFIVKGNSPSYYDSEVGKIYGKDGGPIEPSEGTALLQDKGHDGVLFTHWDQGQMITVFTPSQIKSATENKGTFDKSNDDIRYRKIDNEMRSVPSELDNKLAITTLSPSTEIPVVQTEKRRVSTAEAKQAIESLPKQVVTMDGYALNVSKKTKHKLGNSLSNSTREDYRQALTLLTQIVGNSVLIEEHRNRVKIDGERKADNPNDTNIENVQRFYGAITIGKVTYRVKTTAIVSANTEQGTRMHNYDITEIELLQPETPVSRSSSDQERNNSISLAKLLNGVGFSYEPERKILDEMQGGSEGIRFRQGNNSQTSWNESAAKTEYNRTTRITDENGNKSKSANLLWRLREAYQDSMLSLKALQDALAKNALGRDLRDFEDAYTAENAMGSKNLSEMEHYENRYVKPLTDALGKLIKDGVSYEEIRVYMMAKHGLERNEYYNAQDRATAKDKWDSKEALKHQKNPNYQPKEFEYKGEFKDYSGLTGLTGSSENFTKLAQDMVEEFENKFNTDALWTSVRNANQKTLELGRQKNLIGKQTYEHIKGMFEYYIPLRGWDSNRAEDEWEYLDGAGTMSGNSIRKSAKGRTSVSDDPIAMMIKLAEDTIRQGNRNMMKLKFLNLAENADDKLLQYSHAWFQKKIDQEGNEYWELVTPDIDDDASPEEVSEALLEFNQNMNNLKELGEATQYPPKDSRKNITFDKNGSLGESKQHTVTVYRGGQLYTIFVNGNPRAAQAINGSINAGQYSGQIEKIVGPFNRWISAMHTSYNPEFIITNAVRDFQHATFMIFAQEGLGSKYMKDFQKQYVGGLKRSLGLYKRWRSGTLDLSRNEDKMFHDFMINGGQTGYTQISKIEDLKKKVEWELKKAKGEAGRMKVGFEILQEGLELFNGAIELNTRFATFVASRKSGRSIERSISDAKNITVNFNKKGAGGYGAAFFQALYIFFNPAVQALEQSVRVSRKHPKRIAAMIGTMATLAYLQPILFELIGAAAGGDDDDEDAYDNINQNSRLSSLIIRNPLDTSTYINLPISPELKPFFTLGSALAEVQRGAMTTSEATGQILQGMTSLLPLDPAGGNGDKKWINIVPSVVQPLEQVAVNTNYYGESIYKDNGFNKLDPEWTKAKDANPIFTKTSEMLNEWSGGNKVRKGEIDINPEKVEHLVEGFTGGAGRATNALFKTFMMPFDSDMRQLNNTVMLRKFYKAIPQAKDGVLSRKIYELQERRKELLEHDKLGYKKQLRESKDTVDRMHWMDEMMELVNSPEYKYFKRNKVKLDRLFKLRDKYQKVTNDEIRKTISKSMSQIQKEVLNDYENE